MTDEDLQVAFEEWRTWAEKVQGDRSFPLRLKRMKEVMRRRAQGKDFFVMNARLDESLKCYGPETPAFFQDVCLFLQEYYGVDLRTVKLDDPVVLPACDPNHTLEWVRGLKKGDETVPFESLFGSCEEDDTQDVGEPRCA